MSARTAIRLPCLATLAAAVLALGACERAAMGDGPPPPAPAAKMEVGQPITARGTEPFWALHITEGTRFRLTRPDQPEVSGEAPAAAVDGGRAVWIGRLSDGRQVTVTLYESACSDGMSDLSYPMTAEVTLPGESLTGCAAKTGDLPREGG